MAAPASGPDTSPVAEGWLSGIPLRLVDEVESLVGANRQPMLYHAGRGTYLRLSRMGARVALLLDGTRTGVQIAAELARSPVADAGQVQAAVVRFLGELRNAGVLNVPPAPAPLWQRLLRARPMLRLPLTGSVQGVLRPLASLIRRVPPRPARMVTAGLLVAAALLVTAAWYTGGWPVPGRVAAPALLAALFALQLLCHEGAHALACQLLGAPIREAGVGLLYYFIPVAYVDRTDSYRLQSRGQRAAVALAGPASDLLWAGGAAAVALVGGTAADTAHALLLLQALLFLNNLNPLLPTDGYHALEAAMGELNLRHQAFSYLLHRLLRRPLPSALAYLKPLQGWLYSLYAGLGALYVGLIALFVALTLRGYLISLLPR